MAKKHHVTTTVNGDECDFLCEPQQTLLDCLRDELMLSGTKEGCATGDCGACTVMVDGVMVCSCLVLGVEVDGANIDTIEGMPRTMNSTAAAPFPGAQRPAMRDLHAGHSDCRPRTARAQSRPDRDRNRYWLAGNLCRCTGYDKIIRSVQAAAKEMRGNA